MRYAPFQFTEQQSNPPAQGVDPRNMCRGQLGTAGVGDVEAVPLLLVMPVAGHAGAQVPPVPVDLDNPREIREVARFRASAAEAPQAIEMIQVSVDQAAANRTRMMQDCVTIGPTLRALGRFRPPQASAGRICGTKLEPLDASPRLLALAATKPDDTEQDAVGRTAHSGLRRAAGVRLPPQPAGEACSLDHGGEY